MTETTKTISMWADATFGEPGTEARVATRAAEEMVEVLRAVTSDAPREKVLEEIADTVIVLARLAARHGGDLWVEVEKKMAVNRTRKWEKDGTGHGYHVRDRLGPVKDAIERFNQNIDAIEDRCLEADGPVTPTLQEMTETELSEIWRDLQKIRGAING